MFNLPSIPILPEVHSDDEDDPDSSPFIRKVKNDANYPPLIAPITWTKTVSEKFSSEFYKPSECIGK